MADMLGACAPRWQSVVTLAVAAALGLIGAQGFWLLLAVHLAQAAALAPTTTLADALAVRASVRPQGFEYGWVRGAASVAFIAGTLVAGQVLGHFELTAIVWMHVALLAGALLGAALVPEPDTQAEQCRGPGRRKA